MEDENDRVNAKKITFTYEDQKKFPPAKENLNFDCEAFFWMNDSLYLFTKCRTKPFTGITKVYVLPDKPGKYKARLIGQIQLCGINWQWCGVTSADYNPETKTLAILTYSKLYLIDKFKANRFWKGRVRTYDLPGIKQREAICFKSATSWYLTDEFRKSLGGGNLYNLTLK